MTFDDILQNAHDVWIIDTHDHEWVKRNCDEHEDKWVYKGDPSVPIWKGAMFNSMVGKTEVYALHSNSSTGANFMLAGWAVPNWLVQSAMERA